MRARLPRRGAAALAAALLAGLACRGEPASPRPASAVPRVVVMAPAAAEMLAALGLAQIVVGVGDWVTWPPALAGLPRVGGYDRPNLERLLALDAELYVTTRSVAGAGSRDQIEGLGIEVLELSTDTYDGVLAGLAELGARLDRSAAARGLAATIERRVEAVRARAANARPRRVLVVVGRDPLYVAGPGSHLDFLVAAAGGSNVAADARAPYQLLSLEAALARRPEVIVDMSDNRPGARRGRAAGSWAQWPFLPAVAEDRIYWLDPSRLAIPGPRLPDMAEILARLIHPEIFGAAAPADFTPLAAAPDDAPSS